jgi:hypothetical protein
MARYRNHRVVITPPPRAPAPITAASAPARAPFDTFDFLMRTGVVGLCVVGWVAVISWIDGKVHPLPAPGVVCLDIQRSTSAGRTFSTKCDLDEGWHAERRTDGTIIAIPDDARPLRRSRYYEAADGR